MKEYLTAKSAGVEDLPFTVGELVRAMNDLDSSITDYHEELLVRYAQQALKNRVWDGHAKAMETS